jgi:hypothetical protein
VGEKPRSFVDFTVLCYVNVIQDRIRLHSDCVRRISEERRGTSSCLFKIIVTKLNWDVRIKAKSIRIRNSHFYG